MNRRDFLTGSVFAGTAGLLADCAPASNKMIPILIPEEEFVPGVEEWHATVCLECGGGCGLLVRKIDGRIVKVEGNPKHPVSRGGTCARAQALPQALYHPDRLKSPLARKGERGSGDWAEISWDDAIARLSQTLLRMRAENVTRSFAILTDETSGHRREIVKRFLDAFGSPYHFVHEPFSTRPLSIATKLTCGVEAPVAVDLEASDYAIVFGASLLEGSHSPVRYARGIGALRQGRPGRRGKLVVVSPRLSMTAAKADEWLPARPGSEAAVALALCHSLVASGLYDEKFVRDRSRDFDQFQSRLSRFSPEEVAKVAGVEARTLERIARELARQRPAVALATDTGLSGATGVATAVAVSHLNALLGSYGTPGGVYFDPPPPFAPWPALPRDPISDRARLAYEPTQPLSSVVPYIARGELTIQTLFVSGSNPVFSLPASFGLDKALERIPLIVSFTSFLDETAHHADLVLPEPTPFERFDDGVSASGTGIPAAALGRPLLARPLYPTRGMPDVLIDVATRIGGTLAEAFPWKSYEEALRAAWSGLPGLDWSSALEQGGYWDEGFSRSAAFATADKRYVFDSASLDPAGATPRVSSEHPLSLHIYPSVAFGDGRSAHLPFLQELADPMTGVRWGSVVEIHPRMAAEKGIVAGDTVEVSSPHGRLLVKAFLTEIVRPDVVAIAAGQGHTAYTRYANGRGVNPYALVPPATEPSSGALDFTATRVAIRKAV